MRVEVSGELDLSNAHRLSNAIAGVLSAYRPARLEVDLAGLPWIGSTGIHTLIGAHKAAHTAGCRLVVTHPCPFVREVLLLTGVWDTLSQDPLK